MRRGLGGSGRTRALLLGGLGALGLLALAQLLLPRLAATRISGRLGRYGEVQGVSVSAWPAIELLWGDADSVKIRAGDLSLTPAAAEALMGEGRGTGAVQLTASSVHVAGVTLRDVSFHKSAAALHAEARMTEADVRAALPAGVEVTLLGSAGGRVRVAASGGLLGLLGPVQAEAQASDGALVVHPVGALLGGVQLTLLSQPHIYVEGVGASLTGSSPPAYRLTMSARLR
jgi:LmeA-like phospholipid-binding